MPSPACHWAFQSLLMDCILLDSFQLKGVPQIYFPHTIPIYIYKYFQNGLDFQVVLGVSKSIFRMKYRLLNHESTS